MIEWMDGRVMWVTMNEMSERMSAIVSSETMVDVRSPFVLRSVVS